MRYYSLDIARVFAMTLVLIAHVSQTLDNSFGTFFGFPGLYYVSLGGVGVTIFIILSGMVLELNYGAGCIGYSKFIVKRVIRLYPVYFMVLFFVGIPKQSFKWFIETGSFSGFLDEITLVDFICSSTGTYAFFGFWGGPFVGTSWFIGVILSLYFFYPLISKYISINTNITLFCLFIISLGSRLAIGTDFITLPYRSIDWFPLCRIFEFGFGVYLARKYKGILKVSFHPRCWILQRFTPQAQC